MIERPNRDAGPPLDRESAVIPLIAAPEVANTDEYPTVISQAKPTVPSCTLLAGERLGNFEVIEAVGAGGMATVLKAHDRELGRIVALKILPPESARDPDTIARFKLEGRAAARLDHDNVARVYLCGEDRGLHFIAFEYVEGENLLQRLHHAGVLSPQQAVEYLLQLAGALGHAGERGVVHRDLKPSNILITPEGRVKIVDMGLARQLEGLTANGGITHSGVTLGTFDYISPEQALDPRCVDIRGDIYSLGCTFYHVLTGQPPVPEGTAAKKMHAHQHEYPIDPRDWNPAIPDGLAMILARMMAKKPGDRYQTPAALADDLGELERRIATLGNSQQTTSTRHIDPLVARSHLPLSVWAAALAVCLAAAVLFAVADRPERAANPLPWQEPIAPKYETITPTPNPAVAIPTTPTRIDDARRLAEVLQQFRGESALVKLRPGVVYDLTALEAGILFSGGNLTIEPEANPQGGDLARPVLRLWSVPPTETGGRAGTLTLRDVGRAVFQGIELHLVDPPGVDNSSEDPVGLLLHNTARVEIENCLIRSTAELRKQRTVGVAIARDSRGKPATVTVRHSVFDIGMQSIGLRLVEQTDLELYEVGFAPHQTGVLLIDDDDDTPSGPEARGHIAIRSSTFLFDRGGAAITASNNLRGRLTISATVFADATVLEDKIMMPGTDQRANAPVVLRTEGSSEPALLYRPSEGKAPNGYFRTTPPAGETRAVLLSNAPWFHDDPRPLLQSPNPWDAFVLKLNEKRLRTMGTPHILGMTSHLALDPGVPKPIYPGSWPPAKPELPVKAAANERVVYPDAGPEDATNRLYPTVAKALAELQSGETLIIAANGRVAVDTVLPKISKFIIAAHPSYRPILVPGEETPPRTESALFVLEGNELILQQLQIQLIGRSAIVKMSPGSRVQFEQCVLTLETRVEPSCVAMLVESRTNSAEKSLARIGMDATLIRGSGKAVWLRHSQNVEWTAQDSAFALVGSAFHADLGSSDPTQKVALKWKRTTIATTAPVLELSAGSARLSVDVTADRCLLAPFGRRRFPVMVSIEGGETNTEPASVLNWKSEGPNQYGQYEWMLEQRFANGMKPTEWDVERWMRFSNDMGRVAPVRFAGPVTTGKIRNLKPDDLKAEYETATDGWKAVEVGADAMKLSKPIDEK